MHLALQNGFAVPFVLQTIKIIAVNKSIDEIFQRYKKLRVIQYRRNRIFKF